MKRYECSVIVVQYNPSWENIKQTLNSIISQEDCKYEIIMTDDGSEETYFDRAENYFREKTFRDYRLVRNKKNQGTVKNIISGLEVANGKYVRTIAPGDMLYNTRTLKNTVEFMEKNQAKEIFGKVVCFQQDDDKLTTFINSIPRDIKPYKEQNRKKIYKNLIRFGDNISGASYAWDREYHLDLLKKIEGQVKYLEDCVSTFTILDGYDILYLDEYVTWYEYGTGISTNASEKWTIRLAKDWVGFYSVLIKCGFSNWGIHRAKMYFRMGLNRTILGKIVKNILF